MNNRTFFATCWIFGLTFFWCVGLFLNYRQDVQRWWLQRHLNILTEERSALLFKTADVKDDSILQKTREQLDRLRAQSEQVEARLKVLETQKQIKELKHQITKQMIFFSSIDMSDGKHDELDQSTLIILSKYIQSFRDARDSLIVQRDSLLILIKTDSTKF